VLDTRRDLAAYFIWKQVWLEFSSLPSTLVKAWHGWCTWHHCGGRLDVKQKMVGPMTSGAA
jgi:hypothetical protein